MGMPTYREVEREVIKNCAFNLGCELAKDRNLTNEQRNSALTEGLKVHHAHVMNTPFADGRPWMAIIWHPAHSWMRISDL